MPKSLKITSWCAAIAVLLTLNWASVARAQGTWTPLDPVSCPSPVPCATEGMSLGGVGQVIIAAYGFSLIDTNLTRLYNISSNSWSLGAPAPLPFSSEQAYGETTHGASCTLSAAVRVRYRSAICDATTRLQTPGQLLPPCPRPAQGRQPRFKMTRSSS
jgi:hypothetical protein